MDGWDLRLACEPDDVDRHEGCKAWAACRALPSFGPSCRRFRPSMRPPPPPSAAMHLSSSPALISEGLRLVCMGSLTEQSLTEHSFTDRSFTEGGELGDGTSVLDLVLGSGAEEEASTLSQHTRSTSDQGRTLIEPRYTMASAQRSSQ